LVCHRVVAGFGRALVRAALKAGDVVTATARRQEQLADLVNVHLYRDEQGAAGSACRRTPAGSRLGGVR
jgi:NAD(P)-dependent dehydrogenase (short-subunit alcohol dehydrogenase family)